MTYPRAEKQQDYAHVYLCVRRDGACTSLFAEDGRLKAWTRWDDAVSQAGAHGMIVVNWFWFKAHYLPRLVEAPRAAQIVHRSRRNTQLFHAELDAPAIELRRLETFDHFTFTSLPEPTRARMIAKAKVWPEGLK